MQNYIWVVDSEDLRYLLKLNDYENLPEDAPELSEVWDEINRQYGAAEKDNSQIIDFIKRRELLSLQVELLPLTNMLILLETAPTNESTKDALTYIGMSENQVRQKVKELKNRIKILVKDMERESEKKEAEKFDVYLLIDDIEAITGRPIDIEKTTVRKFITMKNNLKKHYGKEGQNSGKGRS